MGEAHVVAQFMNECTHHPTAGPVVIRADNGERPGQLSYASATAAREEADEIGTQGLAPCMRLVHEAIRGVRQTTDISA